MNSELTSRAIRRRVYAAGLLAFVVAFGAQAATPAARVIYAFGEVSAEDAGGGTRAVSKGDVIAAGDTLLTGRGRAQIKLTDGGFVALKPNTSYAIEDYSYDPADAANSRSFFNLVRGGVRLVTGAVGRANRSGWRMRTAVATIGIRGSEGVFDHIELPNGRIRLDITVTDGGFTATDAQGRQQELGPGQYSCASPCRPVNGPGPADEAPDFTPPLDPPYEGGEDAGGEADPIPAGPAPHGAHLSFAHSFVNTSCCGDQLNAAADGLNASDPDNPMGDNPVLLGTLESFTQNANSMSPFSFTRNGATEIADPTGPGGSTVNEEISAEWGRILSGHVVQSPSFMITNAVNFSYIITTNETPETDLPTGNVIGTYDQIVGGTYPTHAFNADGSGVETGMHEMMVKINFGTGLLEAFVVDGTFPSANLHLQYNPALMLPFHTGFVSFDPAQSFIQTSEPMCSGAMGCTIFGSAVYGFAGTGGTHLTGAYSANTDPFSYPPHTVDSSFALQRSSLLPAAP